MDMRHLKEKGLNVYNEFLRGNHTGSRSISQSFNQVWVDMALDRNINLDSKTKGAIPLISIMQRPSAVKKCFIYSTRENSNHNCYQKNDRFG